MKVHLCLLPAGIRNPRMTLFAVAKSDGRFKFFQAIEAFRVFKAIRLRLKCFCSGWSDVITAALGNERISVALHWPRYYLIL